MSDNPAPPNQPMGGYEPNRPAAMSVAPAASGGILAAIGNVLRFPLLPLTWVVKRFVFKVAEKSGIQVVTFTSFSSAIYCWPIVAVGLINYGLHSAGWVDPQTLGWIWLSTIGFTLLLLSTDINRNAAVVLLLVLSLIFALGALAYAKLNLPVLGHIYGHFGAMRVTFDPGSGRALAELLLIALLIVIVAALFDGNYEVSSREATHRRFLRASESWPLGVNRVRMDWPDLLEMIVLFGAGHVVVIDPDRKEVLRIPNIPCLWFFRDEVNDVLDVMATTQVADTGQRLGA